MAFSTSEITGTVLLCGSRRPLRDSGILGALCGSQRRIPTMTNGSCGEDLVSDVNILEGVDSANSTRRWLNDGFFLGDTTNRGDVQQRVPEGLVRFEGFCKGRDVGARTRMMGGRRFEVAFLLIQI